MGQSGRWWSCRWLVSTAAVTGRCTTPSLAGGWTSIGCAPFLARVPLPRAADGRLVLAVDITCWLRPDAHTSPQRILCHTYGRGKDQTIMVPGWPYLMVVALEAGRSSWTAPLDAVRLAPGADAATVTAGQVRDIVGRLVAAGQWQPGDPDVLVVADAGYDAPRLAFLLADLARAGPRPDALGPGAPLGRATPPAGNDGRPPRHGGEFVFGDPATWGEPDAATATDTRTAPHGPAPGTG